MGLKLAWDMHDAVGGLCFRRTLVGLKHVVRNGGGSDECFRRTLVGLKPPELLARDDVVGRFRRTLVGLKPPNDQQKQRVSAGFRRTLVGLKLP